MGLHIRFRKGEIAESDEIKDDVIVDYDSQGRIIAVEILDVSEILAGEPEITVDLGKKKAAG